MFLVNDVDWCHFWEPFHGIGHVRGQYLEKTDMKEVGQFIDNTVAKILDKILTSFVIAIPPHSQKLVLVSTVFPLCSRIPIICGLLNLQINCGTFVDMPVA
jgi:hypothetical protein